MVSITITVNGSIEDLKAGFLKVVERPEKYSHLTDLQFFKQWLEDNIKAYYRAGKTKIAQETTPPEVDENIITVS